MLVVLAVCIVTSVVCYFVLTAVHGTPEG